MFACPYFIELLTPRKDAPNREADLKRFSARYRRIFDAGCGISIPDNPMGRPRISAVEAIRQSDLPVDGDRIVMNLNTFHSHAELNELLDQAAGLGLRYLLVVRGDGGPQLSKLDPRSVGGQKSVVTSAELIRYIHASRPKSFVTGAAFNQYAPRTFEVRKLHTKIEAGAAYVITQPVIGADSGVLELESLGIPVVVEAWMSKNIDLLIRSVRAEADAAPADYDPFENLALLHNVFPQNCVYLSMLSFQLDWEKHLPRLQGRLPSAGG
jgi:methylenetetrahydrofolate reductase (NADPH)